VPGLVAPTIYLAEEPLHDAIATWLNYAIFGQDRLSYWRECLDAAEADRNNGRAPAATRLAESNSEIADLSRRLQRPILNLKADDSPHRARLLRCQ
jgi:hypothetical protein